ncbi:MAG TPA: DUF2752 domain-containing protein [Thermoanaerobaculaceae bacterium]|nr:DUF2752 domain-containing protein [Thermoanaerobaculaceae bacterium]
MRWRKPKREERQLAWLWGVVAGCSLLLRPLWLELAPFVPACPFRVITGIPCPTCGTTHAALALLNGHLGDAFLANPLAALAGIAFVAGGLIAPFWAAFNWPVPEIPSPLPGWSRVAIVAVLLVGWAYLLVKS